MNSQIQAAIPKRNFRQALIRLLEDDYKIIGSHKVIRMIVDDIIGLYREFHPKETGLSSGTLVWTTTLDEGKRPGLASSVENSPSTTLSFPFLVEKDFSISDKRERLKQRIARLVYFAKEHKALLSVVEIAAMLNLSCASISSLIREYQLEHDKVLPTKGNVLDIGPGTTHKAIILRLYEQGISPLDIARRTKHSLEAVDRYIKDYQRVKLLVRKGLNTNEISQVTGRGKTVVNSYIKLLKEFHPELVYT